MMDKKYNSLTGIIEKLMDKTQTTNAPFEPDEVVDMLSSLIPPRETLAVSSLDIRQIVKMFNLVLEENYTPIWELPCEELIPVPSGLSEFVSSSPSL